MPRDPFEREPEPEIAVVLDALADGDCRDLLEVMARPMSAAELSEASDVPLSTTYRKLDRLEEATLIDERIEIRDDGRHTSQYEPNFDSIELVRNEEHELDLEIVRPPQTADERLEDLWTAVRKEV